MNSKIIKNGILALAFTLVAVPAQAAFGFATPTQAPQASAGSCDAYQAEVNRLLQAQDLRGTTIKAMKSMLAPLVSQGSITTSQVNSIAEEIVNITYPKMKVAVEQCLRQNLSVDELRQINAFYATPAGQKLNALQPVLMEAGTKVAQQPDVQTQIQQVVQKYLGNK